MGRAARANPRSFDGATSERSVLDARLTRFCGFFQDRPSYEAYLLKARVTDEHRRYLERFLPDRLKAA